jgi:RND family efflux transporter MFP subunit
VTFPRRFLPWLRAYLLISLLISLLSLAGCSDKPVEKKLAAPATLITITRAKVQVLEITESTLGALESVIDPKIAAEVPGRVLKIHARSGQTVKKGQLLAELDATDATGQNQVEHAEISRLLSLLAQQERVVTRQNELVAKNFISKNAGDDATAQRDALKSQLMAARARAAVSAHGVGRTRITSPVDGVIEVQIAAPGDYLKVGDPLVRLISNRRLRANLPFPEATGQRLMRGQTVRLTSPLAPGKVIEGRIEDIRPSLLETSRSLEAIARFDNPAGANELLSGGSVNAQVIIERKESAVMVPEQSVVLRPAGKVVYLIVDGVARQQRVDAGARQNGMIEILKGVQAGDTIALDGAGFLSDGAAVSVQERNVVAKSPAKPAETVK